MRQHPNRRTQALLALMLAGAVAVLAACGGGSAKAGTTPTSSTTPAANPNAGGGGRVFGTPPAASGLIAEIDANTVQVQSQSNGQVAVVVTSKTTYTQTLAATLADVQVGGCVLATAPSSSANSANGATPPTSITASAVMITAPVQGSCNRGAGFGGAGGTRVPTDRPSDLPTSLPSGRPSGTRTGNFLAASGQVTAVNGKVITVQAERRTAGSSTSTTYTAIVTTPSSTTFTKTAAATRSALKVGLCMSAAGTTGSDGTVTATRVAISPPTSTGCETTLRRGAFGGGGGAGGGSAGGNGTGNSGG